MSEVFGWAQFWDERRGWCSSRPHPFSETAARGTWVLVTGVTGTKAPSLPSHRFRSHWKGGVPLWGHIVARETSANLEPGPQKSWPLYLTSQEAIRAKKELFQRLGWGRDKAETRLQNWDQWPEEIRKQLLAQCQSKRSKTRACKTSCMQAGSSPQMGFVCTAVGLQHYS